MDTSTRSPSATLAGRALLAVISVWTVWALVDTLEPVGRHFLGLGALRVAMLVALIAFAVAAGARERRLGRAGLAVATLGAAMYVVGGIGSVATDGWSYHPFEDGGTAGPPWYAFVIGFAGMLFALGTALVGFAGHGHRLRVPVILAGVLFPPAVALSQAHDLAGHLVWVAPWVVVGLALAGLRGPAVSASPAAAPARRG